MTEFDGLKQAEDLLKFVPKEEDSEELSPEALKILEEISVPVTDASSPDSWKKMMSEEWLKANGDDQDAYAKAIEELQNLIESDYRSKNVSNKDKSKIDPLSREGRDYIQSLLRDPNVTVNSDLFGIPYDKSKRNALAYEIMSRFRSLAGGGRGLTDRALNKIRTSKYLDMDLIDEKYGDHAGRKKYDI